MTNDLVTADIHIPETLGRALRIREFRLGKGEPPDLEFHPDAAAIAARMRERIEPTTFDLVRRWLNDLASGGLVPQNGNLDSLARGVFMACDDFPASVWSQHSLRAAFRAFKWFPKPAEVHALLKPEADKVLDVVSALEAIAKAPRPLRAVPAWEAYHPPPPPDWVSSRGLKRGKGDHSRPDLNIPPPRRSIAEQVAILRGDGGEAA
jgi:hypothetical protein